MKISSLKRSDCRLRPVRESDLEIMRSWRNSDRIRSVMFTSGLIEAEDQRRWFAGLAGDPTRAYFIFEIGGQPVGTMGYNPIDVEKKTCAWGFYRGAENAPAGAGLALGVLGLEKAFEELGMKLVTAETFRFNEAGRRFHRRLGFVEVGERDFMKNGRAEKVEKFEFSRSLWDRTKADLNAAAFARGSR